MAVQERLHMLSAEQNQLLTDVGAGTPMGDLLRRYWWPVAAQAELEERPTKAVRLLGEDLVLYKDRRGCYGMLAQRCPHRGASLVYGMVEECGLRCCYHGWMFDGTGACVDQPFERVVNPQSRFRDKVSITAYGVQEKAGLLWAYLGPEPAPLLWDWSAFYDRGYKQLILTEVPCHWLQCQENSIDPVHFEWLHNNWTMYQSGSSRRARRHVKVGFDEFEHGFVYRRLLEGGSENDESWRIGRVCLWPAAIYVGNFEWSVPVDHEHTLRIRWSLHPLPGDDPYEQERIPYWYSPLHTTGTGIVGMEQGPIQDLVALVSQGRIADRTREALGESDRGVILLRNRFFADLRAIDAGADPKGVIRSASENVRVSLPCMSDQRRVPGAVVPDPQPGQPQEILEELHALYDRFGRSPVTHCT
jgi:5,5'-dehydrodivanillate O-demethylase oxygenase subunit